MKNFLSLLKNKNFLLLWISQFSSQIALNTLNFLIILKIFDDTGSTIATSLVWLAFILPAILIGPLAAVYVDLVDKRKILLITNFAQSLVILFYALTQANFAYLAYTIVLIYSFFNQFYIPAELSSLPFLVKDKLLSNANGLFLLTYQGALVLGFGLAGLVVESLGFKWSFLAASILVFIAFVSVSFLPKIHSKAELPSSQRQINKFYKEILEGINFIRGNIDVFLVFTTIVALQAILPIIVVNLPSLTKDVLSLNPHFAGIAVTLPASIGAIIGILLVPKLSLSWRKKNLVKRSLTILAFLTITLIIVVPFVPMPYKIIFSTIVFILVGASFISIYITAQTHLQTKTPKYMMARVFGNSWFLTSIATVVPMLFSATITEVFGIKLLILIIALSLLSIRIFYDKILELDISFFKM